MDSERGEEKYSFNMETEKRKEARIFRADAIASVLLLFFVFSSIILANSAGAESVTGFVLMDEDGNNLSSQSYAATCLKESKVIMQTLADDNFSVERVNDTITQAEALYADTLNKKKTDFSLVAELCNEIAKINDLAYQSRDEFWALQKFYGKSITSEMNTTGVDESMAAVQNEIVSERYEKVEAIVDETYTKIIDLKSSYTTLNALNRNLQGFFVRNWKQVLITIFVIVLPLVIFRKTIQRRLIERKIESLEVRKRTLKNLIKQTQKEYFESGRLPEGMYNIRTKKFAEMIRDIDRQVPLLQEELIKLQRHRENKLAEFFHKHEKKK